MASIISIVPEIDRMFFQPDKANKPFTVVKCVRLRDNSGWLMLDDKGRVHAVGRAAERVNGNVCYVGVTAEAGSTWGDVFEGLVALGKITKGQLEEHRAWAEQRRASQARQSDLAELKRICERQNWKFNPQVTA